MSTYELMSFDDFQKEIKKNLNLYFETKSLHFSQIAGQYELERDRRFPDLVYYNKACSDPNCLLVLGEFSITEWTKAQNKNLPPCCPECGNHEFITTKDTTIFAPRPK